MDWYAEEVKRQVALYEGKIVSHRTAMEELGLESLGLSDTRPADVDDWPPDERPEPEDLAAARLLGVEPRPPARPSVARAIYWDEQGEKAMATVKAMVEKMKQTMDENNVPQPRYVIVHPDTLKGL